MSTAEFPGRTWRRADPEGLGCSGEGLASAGEWLAAHGQGRPYRVVVVRAARIVAEWSQDVSPDARAPLASAAKSLYSCLLAIAVAEGKIRSVDDPVVDYYPEMMDVPEGRGPKEGRHAFAKDKAVTFRQLIANTSGYMKPGEEPGTVFHYQTFGMNVLTHAIAKQYGLYDSNDPERLPGCGALIEQKIRDPIGASWTYAYTNFRHAPGARLGVFGHYTQVYADILDMARVGLLWLHGGEWRGVPVVPRQWLAEAVRVAPDIRAHAPQEQWSYGYGFWTNEEGRLWPHLPRDSFAASGAGSRHVWVCPSLDLVVAQSPGVWENQAENDMGVLRMVVDACARG
jgi:CubicO group peptidase (beta-lactamase class C family)